MRVKKILALGALLGLAACAHQAPRTPEDPFEKIGLFGVRFRIYSPAPGAQKAMREYLEAERKNLSEALDPDCYYRKAVNGICSAPADLKSLAEVSAESERAKSESLGAFEVRDRSKRNKRDFGGICQGYVVERLRHLYPQPFVADFAGDIFFSGGFETPQKITINEAFYPAVAYAEVRMSAGWLFSSEAPVYGEAIREPRSGQPTKQHEIRKIVLFGSPQMDGARLDAWSTAIIAGGLPVLRHLKGLSAFEGQWAYLYFDKDDKVHCSEGLDCRLDQQPRLVSPPW